MATSQPRRVIALVIDALGVGAMPDAPDYSDSLSASTLGNIDAHASQLQLPNLARLGLGNILPLRQVPAMADAIGSWGRMAEHSIGKDTTTGHWEMMGIHLDIPFPTYPEGFPQDLIDRFIQEAECGGILANKPASGTKILDELGEEHLRTGFPIVYTSADSVFQIACHVDRVPLATLYRWCEVARRLLDGQHRVSRVIARPFKGEPGAFERVGGDRRDYAVEPPQPNVLSKIVEQGGLTVGVGKIEDIFCHVAVTHAIHTRSNTHGIQVTGQIIDGSLSPDALERADKPLAAFDAPNKQLIFINLVDTDMKYGHRRDVEGYARALEEIDIALGGYLDAMTENDLLMITGDHGCDPTAPGSDHTREYVPILLYAKGLGAQDLGTRATFADLGQTTLDWLGMKGDGLPGTSMLAGLKELAAV